MKRHGFWIAIRARPLWRVAAAVVGGYMFCWGFIALGLVTLLTQGMPFEDAEHLSSILTLLVYLAVFLCAFAARSVFRIWAVLAGGGLFMAVIASLLQHRLVT